MIASAAQRLPSADVTISWRPARPDDAGAIAATVNLALELAGAHERRTEQTVREELTGPFGDPSRDSVVADRDGEVIAYGRLIGPPAGDTTARAFAAVHPDHRGLGIGTQLLDRLVTRARELRAAGGTTEPWTLRMGAEDGDPSAGTLLSANGFTPARFWFEMHRTTDDVPAPLDIDGLELRELHPEDTEALYAAHTAAFADHWGAQVRGIDSFRARVTEASALRPQLCRIAVDDAGTVVGYALAFVEGDPDTVDFGLIGTRREWRGRGVASELVRRSLVAAREAGLTGAVLLVDGDSPTGAVGVYERLGFAVTARSTSYELELS